MDNILNRFGINKVPDEHGQGITRRLRRLWRFYGMVRLDIRTKVSLPIRDTFRAWRYGFSRWSYFLYQLNHHDPRLYVNDLVQFLDIDRINGLHRPACNQKVIFSRYIENLGAPCPYIHAVIVGGQIHLLSGDETAEIQWLYQLLEEYPPGIVLKPIIGYEGFGVTFLRRVETDYEINGRRATKDDVRNVVEKLDSYLITDFAVQHEYAVG